MTTRTGSVRLLPPALTLCAALAAAAVGGALLAGGSATPADGAAAGAPKTHLGATGADHVTLKATGTSGARTFSVVSPDGSLGATPYTPAAGTGLLVREAEVIGGWTSLNQGAGERVVRLRVVAPGGATKTTVALVTVWPSNSVDNGSRIFFHGAWRSDTGFLLGAGARLEVDAPEDLDVATGEPVALALHGDAVVRGVLVRAAR